MTLKVTTEDSVAPTDQESILRENLFTYFLIPDILQQVKDRKLKAVFLKNTSFIKYI